MPDLHYSSWAMDYDGGLDWFDAGESCSHTAHVAGMDLPSKVLLAFDGMSMAL